MSDWYPEFEKDIIQKLKGVKDRDLRFFRVEEFLRMAERADNFAPNCRECYSFRLEIEKQKAAIVKAVTVPGKERRDFDRLQTKMSAHMKRTHGFYPPFYFTYLHSLIWTLGMVTIAFLVSFLFADAEMWMFLAPAFAVGVVVGQVIGGKKDRHIRDAEKIL